MGVNGLSIIQLAIIVDINQDRIHFTVTVRIYKLCVLSIDCSITDRDKGAIFKVALIYTDDVDINLVGITITIVRDVIHRLVVNCHYCWLICSRSIGRRVNLGHDVMAVLNTLFIGHSLPFGVIGTISTIYVAVPYESSSGANFGSGSRKSLAERHVITNGMSFQNCCDMGFRRVNRALFILDIRLLARIISFCKSIVSQSTDQYTGNATYKNGLPGKGGGFITLYFGIRLYSGRLSKFGRGNVLCFHDLLVYYLFLLAKLRW